MQTDDFIIRIENLIAHFGVSTSAFADKIGVQRSGISHLLSGRNKPSLDFILKIMSVFPEINIHWLLTGIGDMLADELPGNGGAPIEFKKRKEKVTPAKMNADKEVEKIVIFYINGTFKSYRPN